MGGATTTFNFNQEPSPGDLQNARDHPTWTNFELAARAKRVFIYNATGVLTPDGIPLKNFLRIGH